VLAVRHANQEMQRQEKRDQRLTDETALRKHASQKDEAHS
jgi:hypothetical protein